MPSRITFRGVNLFGNDYQIERATAFGATGTFQNEDILELGNSGIAGIVDDIENVEVTLDSNDYGSIRTAAIMAGKDPATATYVDLRDFEYANVDIYAHVKPPTETNILFAQYIERAYLTSLGLNYTVDGNATESYRLASDNKRWFMNGAQNIVAQTVNGPATPSTQVTVTFTGITTVDQVLAVFKNGTRMKVVSTTPAASDEVKATITTNQVALTFYSSVSSSDSIKVRVAGDAGGALYAPPSGIAAVRRGHIEVYLLKDVVYSNGGNITSATEVFLSVARSVSFDATLNRTDIQALHTAQYVDRPLEFPSTVNISLEINHDSLNTFLQLAGLEPATAKSASLRGWPKNLGMRVKIFDKRDTDPGTRTLLKRIDVPYIIPNDEAWSGNTGTNFDQTFSFRSHELRMVKI